MLFPKMKTERAVKPRAGRGTDGYLGTQLSVSLGAPGCDGGRPLAGGPALAGDAGRSGSGPVLLAEQGPGSTGGVTGGLLGARKALPPAAPPPSAPRAACASWQGPFSSDSALGAGEPRGRQDQGGPGSPAVPRQLQGGPGCPPEGQLWSASPRAGGLRGGCGCPRAWLPARSPGPRPLSPEDGKDQAWRVWPPGVSWLRRARARRMRGGGTSPHPSRRAANALAPLVFSRPYLFRNSLERGLWAPCVVPGPGRSRSVSSHAEPRGADRVCRAPRPRRQRRVQPSSAAARRTRRAAGSLFGTV